MYTLTNWGGVVKDLGNGWIMSIPEDPDNKEWKEYQAWLAASNTPAEAPVEPTLTPDE